MGCARREMISSGAPMCLVRMRHRGGTGLRGSRLHTKELWCGSADRCLVRALKDLRPACRLAQLGRHILSLRRRQGFPPRTGRGFVA